MTTSDAEREAALATEALDPVDLSLLNSIRAHFDESDPVPDGLAERIQFQLTLDALTSEVATLMQLDPATAGVRTAATEAVRTITFTSESLTTMVTLSPRPGNTVRVDGWAAPGAGIRVELLGNDGPLETYADEDGRFVFDGVPSGLAKFALYVQRGEEVATVLSPAIQI